MSVEPQKPQGTPGPPFIATAPALESLALLDRGLGSREPFVLVTGEPGVGKSVLVREARRRWGGRVCARELAPAEANAETLFATLLGRFGGTTNAQASGPALAQRLVEAIAQGASGGKVAMVVVDDAQTAAPELLLQLANVAEMARRRQCAFEILLVGTPELSARLNDPRLTSLAGKLAPQVRLSPLTQHDTRHYLLQRSGHDAAAVGSGMFSRKACRDIHGATFGIPRAIEALADESARRAARAGVTTISPEHVRSATQALRARRGSAPVTAPRAERANTTAPKPAANGADAPPARAVEPERATPKPVAAKTEPAAAKNEPAARKTEPAAAKVKPVAATLQPEAAGTAAPSATVASPSGAAPFPESSDQRVKDWVSRFGGGGGVRIGMGLGIPRHDAPAAFEGMPLPSAGSTGAPTPAPKRILIVDQEPPLPPELVSRLSKLSKQKRRRGPSTTVQGAALAVVVALLVVLLARHAGFGKRPGLDAADTSARTVATPAPPLALGPRVGPGSGTVPRAGTASVRNSVVLVPSEPAPVKPSGSVAKPSPRPATKGALATAPVRAESLPPGSDGLASSRPAPSTMAPIGSDDIEDRSASPHQRFGIIAGSFPTNDMAKAEKDHLARLTTYRVWVTKSKVNGVRTFHLMVGRFDTMERAWESGQTLMRRGLIRDASVRPLTERESR